MEIGLTASFGTLGPQTAKVARAIEAAGFESFWAGEHIIVPVEIADPFRRGVLLPEMYRHLPDLFIGLAVAAGVTTRLKLGTNICLVAQRHPLVLAKQIATLDSMSGGRFILGAGSGWIEEESAIMGVPFKQKVKMTNECLAALKVIWTQDTPSFSGEFVSFPPVYSFPKPHQKPHPPILIGAGDGTTDNARILKRVAEIADGWLPLNLSPAQVKAERAQLDELCAQNARRPEDMDISVVVPSPVLGIDATSKGSSAKAKEMIAEYAEAGATRLIVVPWDTFANLTVDVGSVEVVARALDLSSG
jgi:probable F420-dependent oxidoreductase